MDHTHLIQPSFDSPLTSTILELEKLRYRRIHTSEVAPLIFLQIKGIFQLLESLESVRIEGNNTTLAELIENTIANKKPSNETWQELENINIALKFIDTYVQKDSLINRAFISELHKIVVKDLHRDGDRTPGSYRNDDVAISNSEHKPIAPHLIQDYMDELFSFINTKRESKYNLLVTATVHHRFVWIHPFRNGNGRVVRLLTYAMLVSQGFLVGNVLNPTAIFCNDRNKYYAFLAQADTGTNDGIEAWCSYVLENLLLEMSKIEQLLDIDYLTEKIIFPALRLSLEKKNLSQEEHDVLQVAIKAGEFKAGNLKNVLRKRHPSDITRVIKGLKDQNIIDSLPNSPRKYSVTLTNNYLLRDIIHFLKKEGFIPLAD